MKGKSKVLLFILVTIGLGGCGMDRSVGGIQKEKQERTEAFIQTQFEEYMKESYGNADYKIEGIIYSGLNQNYDQMNGYSEKDDMKGSFIVRRWDEEGTVRYQDSYQGLLLRQELEAAVGTLANSFFEEYKIYADTTYLWIKENGNPDLTLEEAIKNGENLGCNIWIMVDPSSFATENEFEEAAMEFSESWHETGIEAYFSIYYLKAGVLEQLSRENYSDMLTGKNFKDIVNVNVKMNE